jgi:hypothetical protein
MPACYCSHSAFERSLYHGHAGMSEADKAELLAKWDRADGECCVCMDAPGADVAVLTRCGHGPMCRECIEGHLQSQVPDAYGSSAPLAQCAPFPKDLTRCLVMDAQHGCICAKLQGNQMQHYAPDGYAIRKDAVVPGRALASVYVWIALAAHEGVVKNM